MSKLYLDLAVAIFFLVSLVFVFNLKTQIQGRDKTAFNFLFAGLSILAVMSLLTAVQNQLLVQKVIAESLTAYTEFVRMTMFISGLVLLTTGVARWLSIANSRMNNESSSANELLHKRMTYELSTSSSIKEFFPRSLSLLSDAVPIESAAIYLVSRTNNRARLLAGECSFETIGQLNREIVFTPGWINGLNDYMLTFADNKVMTTRDGSTDSRYCFAIRTNGKPRFLFLLSAKEGIRNLSELSILVKSISNVFKSKMTVQKNNLKLHHLDNCKTVAESISNSGQNKETVNEKVLAIRDQLAKYVSVDFISICSINKDGVGRRVSIGESGTILNEIGVNVVSDSEYMLRAINTNKTQMIDDLKELTSDLTPELLNMSAIETLLVIPLVGGSGIKGAVTFGSNNTTGYTARERELVESAKGTFERVLHEMSIEEKVAETTRREKLLREFVADIASSDTETEMYRRAAKAISKVAECPIIRISTVDAEQKFISSRAMINPESKKIKVPENGHVLLSLLPWHKVAVTNANTVMINCGSAEGKMSDIETRQVFAVDAKRVAVVPIKFGNKVHGLISLAQFSADMANDLSSSKLQFVETIAALIAISIDSTNRSSDSLAEFASTARAEIIESSKNRNIRSQLRSSLTSIIGSLDMIRAGQTDHKISDNRFLSIIDKSAHRLEELLRE